MPSYNNLYPEVDDRIAEICNDHLKCKAPVCAGDVMKTSKPICPNVRSVTACALDVYSIIYTDCDNHDLWIVAGGYASYIAGRTKCYTDIDIFVRCTCALTPGTNNFGNISVHVNYNVVSMSIINITVQINQVPFSLTSANNPLTHELLDMFAFHVLCNFDIPAYRVALRYDLYGLKNPYVLDVSSVDYEKEKVKEARVMKYQARMTEKPYEPPSLKLLCLFNLFKAVN